MRLANHRLLSIVAVCDSLEQIIYPQQLHYPLPVRYICVREQPQLHLRAVYVLQ